MNRLARATAAVAAIAPAAILFLGLAIAGCSDSNTATVNPDTVAGVYTSTQFTEPGPNDAPIDVHKAGGYLNLTVARDHTVTGRLVIPAGTGTGDDGADREFTGTWKAAGAGIAVAGTGTLIDGAEWICGAGFLEMSRGGRSPLTIRLEKMHDVPK